MIGTAPVTTIACLLNACACPSPRLHLSGGRLVELTNRNQLLLSISSLPLIADSLTMRAAADSPGFLQSICEINPAIAQQITPLSSKDYISTLVWCEVAATFRGPSVIGDTDAGSNDFKRALQEVGIKLSSASGSGHTVTIRWRNVTSSAASKTTIFNLGFYPPELKEAFVKKAEALQAKLSGFWLLKHELQVSDVVAQKGYKFYVPVPPGFSDETLITALVEQCGLNPDYLMAFGFDVLKKAACNAPSGDMYFMFDPAGCAHHGSDVIDGDSDTYEPLEAILQPPSRCFVTHTDGTEHHLKVRKAGACNFCWHVPGRHSDCIYKYVCKMCLVRWEDMENGGQRHACGQGEMSKDKVQTAFNPNMAADQPKPESDIACELRLRTESNIRDAKRKRIEAKVAAARESEENLELDLFGIGGEDEENAIDLEEETEEGEVREPKAPKSSANASPAHPAGTSP
jgi:hypothetical protein